MNALNFQSCLRPPFRFHNGDFVRPHSVPRGGIAHKKALFDLPTIARIAVLIIQHQARKASPEDLARGLTELEAMSEEQTERRTAEVGSGKHQSRRV